MWQNRLISKKKSSLERRCNKSVDFYALFGVVGGVCGVEKGMHFGAQVWFSIPFLDLSGGFAARKKGMHFGARVWISMPFLGFLGEAAAWKKGKQFEVSGRGWRRKLFDLIPLILLYLIPLILLYLIPLKHRVVRGKKLKKGHLLKGCSWGPNSLKEDTCWSVLLVLFVRAKKLEKGHLLKCPFGVVREG